jgi:ABC-type multidrug transport system ATPase subunit
MSEGILKALIQLFALIAFPHKDNKSRRDIVKNFLDKQLNHQMVEEYLNLYEFYYQEHVSKLAKLQKFKQARLTLTANSVKALRISKAINQELTHYQKLIVLIQLIEFLKSGAEISNYERDFLQTIAETFHIEEEEYVLMEEFVVSDIYSHIDNPNSLIINNNKIHLLKYCRHLFWHNLNNELQVLRIKSGELYLLKINDKIEININGQILSPEKIHILTPGSSIRNNRIDPIYYTDILDCYTSDTISTPISLSAKNISYRFKNKVIGLHELSFLSESGKLVGIMGASGAGKSTLINILSGIYKPQKGKVLINDIDIHKEPEKIEGLIGYVSQDDLLMEKLTVYQNLYYNAKLCFGNFSSFEIIKRVNDLLSSLGLNEIKDMKVGSPLNKKISGGQRKRLNIALELIREPAVLFLDEPTSGLSSRDSANILDLLKELALKGKLVFVVIHQPSSDIFKMFNQLLVLDTGGYIVYDGDPVASIHYFKSCINQANRQENECSSCGNVNPEQILNIVNSQVVDEYGKFTQNRKIEPKEWYIKFQKEEKRQIFNGKEKSKILPPINFKAPSNLKQFIVFIKRDILSKIANRQYLAINLLETPVLALILSSLIKYYNIDIAGTREYVFQNNPNIIIYIIMAVIIAMFVGLSVSAQEIIKDRKILKREEFLHLNRFSYLLSKVFILTIISAIQTLLFVLIGNYIVEIKGMHFEYWIVLFSTSIFANLLGLNISDSFKETVNIYILIPFLIIPQIILSGVFISFDHLNPKYSNPEKVPWYGELITAKWAFEALTVNQYINNDFQKELYVYEKIKSEANYKKEYWIPTLEAKLDNTLKNYQARNMEALSASLNLIKTEIENENKRGLIQLTQAFSSHIAIDSFTINDYKTTKSFLKQKKIKYRKLFNQTDILLDKKKKELTNTPEKRIRFNQLKKENSNIELERFVRNTNKIYTNKIIEVNGKLVQKADPIYKAPTSRFLFSHFLSPYKNFGSIKVDTIWANTIVIWIFNLILFLMLQLEIFKRILNNSFELYKRLKITKEQ